MHCVHSSNTIFTIHTAHTHQLHSVCISYSSHEVIYHDYSVTSCRQLNYNKVAVIANSSRGEMCLTAGAGGDIETLLSCSAVKFQSALSVRFVCSELHVGLVIADGDQHWQLLVLISFAPKQIKWHHLETVRSIEKKGLIQFEHLLEASLPCHISLLYTRNFLQNRRPSTISIRYTIY